MPLFGGVEEFSSTYIFPQPSRSEESDVDGSNTRLEIIPIDYNDSPDSVSNIVVTLSHAQQLSSKSLGDVRSLRYN